ncbi:Right handed beta helix region [Actinacidiphila yanglinensis]|uniref:Right handed beta helix region n=1 Tax=Actinacidiphila yanglinensis TaxID=310779 RepID=A0A1H6EBK5_9ACTN|nr:right-handed parallel beta-helix repeat-containing protein [Actinacidiphila yanglinensis]SEG95170.1 Right handed beta helix region [Actinacidiphila yanglinensis]
MFTTSRQDRVPQHGRSPLPRSRPRLFGVSAAALACTAAAVLTAGALATAPASAATAVAHTYYVSTTGSDSNNGTATTTPFRTVQKCADLAQAGDTCSIMGGTYHETVTPAHSGTAGAPISFTPYGGQHVVIDGADPVTGWSKVSAADLSTLTAADSHVTGSPFAGAVGAGTMYQAPLSVNASLAGNELFYDGTAANQAQWPDPGVDPLTPTIEYAGTGTTATSIADPALTEPAGYWTGASAYTSHWYDVQTTAVTSSAPGSVTLASSPNLGLEAGNQVRYYLFGTLETFSHAGQWFYDRTAQKLYLWSPDGSSPASHAVEVKQRTYAFDFGAVSHIAVNALTLNGATVTTGDSSTDVVLTRIDAEYPSSFSTAATYIQGSKDTGIILRGTGNSLRDSTVAHSSGNGVVLLGTGNLVSGTVIHDVDAMGTYTAGVNIAGNSETVTRNTIYRTGRSGILVDWHALTPATTASGETFSYNDISGYARLSVDTGGIYAGVNLTLPGSSIDHNWVHDATPLPLVKTYALAGIYLDGGTGGGEVYDNVGWNQIFGTVFMNTHGLGTKVYDNDGGVQLYTGTYDSGTEVENNIGADLAAVSSGGVLIGHNLPAATAPLYADPAPGGTDYRLQAGSPARNAGAVVSGITLNYTDPQPSIGAYQYGAPYWTAGASGTVPAGLLFATAGTGSYTVAAGGSTAVPLNATMTDGSTANVAASNATYTVVDPATASVDSNGTVHGLATGTTVVTVQAVYQGQVANGRYTVTVPPASSTLPTGYSLTHLGTDFYGGATNGYATVSGSGSGTIATTGYNIWSSTDSGSFLHTEVSGTGDVTATVTITAQSVPPCGVGLMIRDGSAANAKEISFRSQDGGLRLVYRNESTLPNTGYLTTAKPVITLPVQLKLVKSGSTFTATYNTGSGWTAMGTTTATMGTSLEVGLGIYSGAYSGTSASFDDLAAATA